MARIRSNVLALGVIQITNLAIPLITLPYLTRVLGAEAFGKVALVQAVTAYLVLFVDFGFSWSATRSIAANRHDRQAVSRTFWESWVAQWLLCGLATLILGAALALIPRFREDWQLFAAGLLQVLGTVLFPIWLLQGLEHLRLSAFFLLAGRLLTLPWVFILVKSPDGAVFSLILSGSGPIVAGLFSLFWIFRNKLVELLVPTPDTVWKALREGAALFVSRLSVSAYSALTPILLDIAAGTKELGYFNLANKICAAALCGIVPFSQALFPRMSNLYAHDRKSANRLIRYSILVVGAFACLISLGLWLLAGFAIHLLGGDQFRSSVTVLECLALLPVIKGISNIAGVQIMIPNNMHSAMNRIMLGGFLVTTLMIWPMSAHYGALGAAVTSLVTESCITVLMIICIIKSGMLRHD